MKFVIKQEILLESLNHTSRAISPRNLIPILTGIKFDLKEEGLFLSASDTDISIRCLIPNDKIEEISELGSVVIGGKYIVEIIDNDNIVANNKDYINLTRLYEEIGNYALGNTKSYKYVK